MTAEGWALVSALCFAGSHVASKRGLQGTSVTGASLIVLGISWAVISTTLLIEPEGRISRDALLLYGGLGLIVPAISRLAVLKGVDALGPSIAIPIQQGLRPLLSVVGALLLLGERVAPLQGLGIAAIIAGGWQLSRRPREARSVVTVEGALDGAVPAPGTGARPGFFRPGILFPVIAATAYSASDLLVRRTIGEVAEPGVAAMVSSGTGFLVWLMAVAAVPRVRTSIRVGRSGWWLVLAGALIGLAILSMFHALRRGDVSVVTPINSTQPLLVLVLSALLLRDLERIRPMTVVSAVAIAAGAILVSL